MTEPKGTQAEPRVQTAPYSSRNIIALHAAVGRLLVVQLPEGQSLTTATFSDTKKMLSPVIVANSLTLKAAAPMSAQPLLVYATTADGAPRVYEFEFDAAPSSDGDAQPFSVTVTDPAAAIAAKAAAWHRSEATRKEAAARALLNVPPPPPRINTDYTARGSAALLGR